METHLAWPHLTLREATNLLLPVCPGNSSHSLRYFYTAVSESSQGLPQFIVVGYVDDTQFVQYDSETRKAQPQVSWIKKVEKEDPHYWNRSNHLFEGAERVLKGNLVTLKNRFNQSGDFHSLQEMLGCELGPDGSKGGYWQFGYDGRDFVSFDLKTLTWTAANTEAQVTKRKWDANLALNQYWKAYLDQICIEWLRRYLDYGKEVLLRKERPVGKVTRQPRPDGQESLICQAYGFYPRDIDTTWRRAGEVMEHATFRRDVAPNSDGTYHAWLSIEVDPQDKNRYSCHIEHDSLLKPLVLAWEEPGNVWSIVGPILGVLLLVVLLVSGIIFIIRRIRRSRTICKAASTSDQGSDSPSKAFYNRGVRDEPRRILPMISADPKRR